MANVPSSASAHVPSAARVCVLIVHFRDPDSLAACCRSLDATAPEWPIYVVDNDSGEPTASAARAVVLSRARAHWIDAGRNGGFGAGCNRGFATLINAPETFDWVLLLNPDAVLEAGSVPALLEEARAHPEAGAIGAQLWDGAGTAVIYENGRCKPYTLARMHVKAPSGAASFETEFITGALMLVRVDLLRAGLRFDERYFLYVEDLDFCAEMRARGWKLRVTLAARARHVGGASHAEQKPVLGMLRPLQLREMTRSKVIFAKKWLPWFQRWVFYGIAITVKPLLGILLQRRVRFLSAYFGGFWAGLRSGADRRAC